MRKLLLITAISLSSSLYAAEIIHNFNSPAFSGAGYSSHVLTIKQLEDQAKASNKAAAETLKAKADAEAANTPQARFLANLESRIYSQLAKQLTDSLFSDGTTTPTCNASTAGQICGTIPDLGGNSVSWKLGTGSDNGMIVITIQSLSNPNNVTTMKVPSGTFYF